MKILFRYILKQYLTNLILGLFIFTFVLLLDRLFELVDLLINKGVGILFTLRLLFLLLPSSLSLTLPMSNLLASLLTFGALSETNEITAIRASGVSAWNFIKVPLLVSGLCTFFLVPFNTHWAPQAHSRFRQLFMQVLQRNPLVRIEEKTFFEIGDYHLYVEKKSRKSGLLRGVTIYKTPVEGAPLRIYAESGEASVDPSRGMRLILHEGHINEIDTHRPDRWFFTAFQTYVLFIPFEVQKPGSVRAMEEMDNAELRKQIAALREKGLPYPIFSCEIHLRWALALTPVFFALLGVPLAIQVRRGGRSIGFGISLLIVLVYYVLLMGGLSAGQRGVLPVAIALWIGNGVVALVGIVLSGRLLRQ